MNYNTFLNQKKKTAIRSGFEVENLNPNLKDFQEFIVRKALKAGRYCIFADTGLGKTLMQLECANQVVKHTNQPVLVLGLYEL